MRFVEAMRVQVSSYGLLRDKLGKDRLVDLPPGASLKDLLQQLGLLHVTIWIVRVNGNEFELDGVLNDGDRITIIPPVAGGAGPDCGARMNKPFVQH